MKHERQKKMVKVTATVAVLASLAAGMLFGSADDITPEMKHAKISQPPIVMDIDEYGNTTVDDDDEDAEEKKGVSGLVARIKQELMSLPLAARLLIITPLWIIGTVIMTVVSVLGRGIAASPIGSFILSTVVGFGILVGLLAITAKAFFPDIPLKKIFTRNNILTLLIISMLLSGADLVAPLFWAEYPLIAGLTKFAIGALVIIICIEEIKGVESKLGLNRR